MQPKSASRLQHIVDACDAVLSFSEGRSLEDYMNDLMLRSAVERQLMIMGEALNWLAKQDAETAGRIENYRGVIQFRNVVVHGYFALDHQLVWSVVREDVPVLRSQAAQLIARPDDGEAPA